MNAANPYAFGAALCLLVAFFWPYLRGWYESWRDDTDGWYLRRRLPCLLLGHRRRLSSIVFVGPRPTRCRCERCGLRWERSDGGRWKRLPPLPWRIARLTDGQVRKLRSEIAKNARGMYRDDDPGRAPVCHLRWNAWGPLCPDIKAGDASLIYGKMYSAGEFGMDLPTCPTCKDRNAKHMNPK